MPRVPTASAPQPRMDGPQPSFTDLSIVAAGMVEQEQARQFADSINETETDDDQRYLNLQYRYYTRKEPITKGAMDFMLKYEKEHPAVIKRLKSGDV